MPGPRSTDPAAWRPPLPKLPKLPQLRWPLPLPIPLPLPGWWRWKIFQLILGRPALAVPAYMVERPGHFDSSGAEMTRQWLFDQWARIAAAGKAVRVVVVEGSVQGLDPAWATYQQWVAALDACRSAGQQVYGYVTAAGGTRPPAQVAAEVAQWQTHVAGHLDGIYLDVGPTTCDAQVAANYAAYVADIRGRGLNVFLLAAQWPDDEMDAAGNPNPWLRQLDPNFVQLWEEGVNAYRNQYGALDYCTTLNVIPPPDWWTDLLRWFPVALPGPQSKMDLGHSTRRIHVVNDCADVATMRQLVTEIAARGARTMWVTKARQDPVLGSVYDELPAYFDDMVTAVRDLP